MADKSSSAVLNCLTGLSHIFLICRCRIIVLPFSKAQWPVDSVAVQIPLETWAWKALCIEQCTPFCLESGELWKAAWPMLGSLHHVAKQLLPSLQLLCLCRSCAVLAETFLPGMEMKKLFFSTEDLLVLWQCCNELADLDCALSFPKHSSRLWCSDAQDRAVDFPGSSEVCKGMCFPGPCYWADGLLLLILIGLLQSTVASFPSINPFTLWLQFPKRWFYHDQVP